MSRCIKEQLLISIHTPRVGSDWTPGPWKERRNISIHAPRVGSDSAPKLARLKVIRISIHAPRVGSDAACLARGISPADFNPRSPCGERRSCLTRPPLSIADFNPRSPCGERLLECPFCKSDKVFQSTLPVWGATDVVCSCKAPKYISIHAPRVGSDCVLLRQALGEAQNFNPRSPCGERRDRIQQVYGHCPISIHAPRVGSDATPSWNAWRVTISIHAPRVGSDVVRFHPRASL